MIKFIYNNKSYTIDKNDELPSTPYLMTKVPTIIGVPNTNGAFMNTRRHFKDVEYTVIGRKTFATPYFMNEYLWWIGATEVSIDGVHAEKPEVKSKALPVKKPSMKVDDEKMYSIKEGDQFNTLNYGYLTVGEKYNSFYMTVRFNNTGKELLASSADIIAGTLIDTSIIDEYENADLPWK